MQKKRSILIVCFLLCLFLFTGCTSTPDTSSYQGVKETARLAIDQALSSGSTSNATVALMDNGQIVYQEGFGMYSREDALPVDEKTQYNIGSVSKVFTSTAILTLCQEGKLDLDTPVISYLPQFTMEDERYKQITVRMLLNHSSGLPGTFMKEAFGNEINQNYTADFMAYLKASSLKSAPGEISVYCNDGFILAQILIEQVSGMSYADYMQETIFTPAGMENSSCYFKEGNSNIAKIYNNVSGSSYPTEYVNLMGTGGLSSTAVDLCKFAQSVFSDEILNSDSIKEFTSPQYAPKTVPDGASMYQYGLGWDTVSVEQFSNQGITVLSKNGATINYNSIFYVVPEYHISFAVIVSGSADTTAIANAVLSEYLTEKGILTSATTVTSTASLNTSIPDNLSVFEGYYAGQGNIILLNFDKTNNTLLYQTFQNGDFVLAESYPYEQDGYFHMPDGSRLSFQEDSNGKYLIVHSESGEGGFVLAESIVAANANVDGSLFEGKTWLPANLTVTEFVVYAAQTGLLGPLSGYMYVYDGSYIPYLLNTPTSASMTLRYARDQVEPKLVENTNGQMLQLSGYLFTDAAKASPLLTKEQITCGDYNEARVAINDCTLSLELPTGCRVIVFSPELDVTYDSLMDGILSPSIQAGSYILLIGPKDTVITYSSTGDF